MPAPILLTLLTLVKMMAGAGILACPPRNSDHRKPATHVGRESPPLQTVLSSCHGNYQTTLQTCTVPVIKWADTKRTQMHVRSFLHLLFINVWG